MYGMMCLGFSSLGLAPNPQIIEQLHNVTNIFLEHQVEGFSMQPESLKTITGNTHTFVSMLQVPGVLWGCAPIRLVFPPSGV